MTAQVDIAQTRFGNDDAFIDWMGGHFNGEVDPRVRMRLVCDGLARHLSVTRVGYAEVDPDSFLVTVPEDWGSGVLTACRQLERDSRVVSTFLRGDVIAFADYRDQPMSMAEREMMAATGNVAGVVVPLLQDGQLTALFSTMNATPRDWTVAEIALIRRVANHTKFAIGYARSLDNVRRSEMQFRSLAENMPGLCWLAGPDGRAFWMNRAGLDFFGEASLAPDNAERIVHPDEYAEVMAAWDQARRDGVPLEMTVRTMGSDGLYHPLLSRAHPVHDEAGNIIRWTGVQVDLTEERTRKRHEDMVRSLAERTREMSDVWAILDLTLDMLGRHLVAAHVAYSETDPADRGAFATIRDWGDKVPRPMHGQWRNADFPRLADAYGLGRSIVCTDCTDDETIDETMRQRLSARGIRSGISTPLIKQGELVAVLSVHVTEARQWRPEEIRLVEDVAERTWASLARARAERILVERERSQAVLLAWSDSVRNESDPRRILDKTLAAMGEHLGVQRVNFAEIDDTGTTLLVRSEWVNGLHSVIGARFALRELGKSVYAAHLQGQVFQTNDAFNDGRFDPDTLALYEGVGARAIISIPRLQDGKMLAVLSVQQSTPRMWSEADVRLMLDLADRTWPILDRARSEEKLAESEALLAGFLENAPIAMYLKDADGRYIRVNAEMGRVMGMAPEETIGKTAAEVVAPDIARKVAQLDRKALSKGVQSAELAFPDREALSSVLSIRFPIATPDGKPSKLGGFAIDLTEQKRAEAALQKSRDALFQSEKLNALGSLLAGVSHELNNPLSIVVAQAVMLERQARGTELADRGYKIRKAADRCARIVQTFLAMARQKRPERDAVDLNAVAATAVELADYGLKTDSIAVDCLFTDSLPLISADRDQLHQVIINLIVNAQQAMVTAGTVDRRLILHTAPGTEPRTVVLDVIDTGPGVPSEVGRRIFEPFYTTKPEGQGTGVGLSFSQGLVEAHGGRLELIHNADRENGAHFRLTLPVDANRTLGPVAAEAESEAEPAQRSALIVDDEREIAESLADFLSLEGFACDIVIGGAAARTRLSERDYDLVISDLRMPDVDGPQLYAWLQSEKPGLASRMAFVTGDTLGGAAARFIADAKRPVLEKPFMPAGVRRLLKQMELA